MFSNGNLVSSIATDDPGIAKQVAEESRSFKVGINTLRSRGDKDEVFGGIGQSWKGRFVGGKYLALAVTQGQARKTLREFTKLHVATRRDIISSRNGQSMIGPAQFIR